MQMERDKREVEKQWNGDPCGAVTASAVVPESAEWYESVRRSRYAEYAPWLPGAMRFEEWGGRDILEIGVGLGSDHLSFARAGARTHALDLSSEHLRHTQKHLSYHGLKTEAALGDAEVNPFPDGRFDLVYAFGVLHHTPHTEVAIREVYRVLKPGGTALITLYHRDSWFFWINTVMVAGVAKLGFPRKGWRRVLSEIEYRSEGNDAVPLVKVYSRGQARALFADFAEVEVSTHHVEAAHFWRFGRPLQQVARADLERRFGAGGWYVVVRAKKSATSR